MTYLSKLYCLKKNLLEERIGNYPKMFTKIDFFPKKSEIIKNNGQL